MKTESIKINQNETTLRQEPTETGDKPVAKPSPEHREAKPKASDHYSGISPRLPAHLGGMAPKAAGTMDVLTAGALPTEGASWDVGSPSDMLKVVELIEKVYDKAYKFGSWLDETVKTATDRSLTDHIAEKAARAIDGCVPAPERGEGFAVCPVED